MKKRPPGLIAIALYKLLLGSLLSVTSVTLLLTLTSYKGLQACAASYQLESQHRRTVWGLGQVLKLSPCKLECRGIAAVIDATVTLIAAIGLWQGKVWAEILVIVLVSASIPLEIHELVNSATVVKVIILL